MTNEPKDVLTTEERIKLISELEVIFMPQARRQREQAFESLRKSGVNDEQLRFVHYTSAEAALSIIRNKRLWMRNTTCMADYREVEHGFEMLNKFFSDETKKNAFNAAVDQCFPGATKEAVDLFNKWWNNIRYNTYVTSVSEHDKSEDDHGRLSMWRAFGGNAIRIAIVVKVPKVSQGSFSLNLMFSPVAYLKEAEAHAVLQEVILNVKAKADFVRSVGRQQIVEMLFTVFVAGVTCLKHEGFREEREWRAIYLPKIRPSELMQSSNEIVNGVPQIVHKIPVDESVSPLLADLEFSRIFDHLIVGPSPYPWVMYEAFAEELKKAGVPDASEKVLVSNIPIRM
jgi:hypothetical protein